MKNIFKKMLSGALVLSMCSSMMSVVSAEETVHNHQFDNPGFVTEDGSDYHWQACTDSQCPDGGKVNETAHQWAKSADGITDLCPYCRATRKHVHDFVQVGEGLANQLTCVQKPQYLYQCSIAGCFDTELRDDPTWDGKLLPHEWHINMEQTELICTMCGTTKDHTHDYKYYTERFEDRGCQEVMNVWAECKDPDCRFATNLPHPEGLKGNHAYESTYITKPTMTTTGKAVKECLVCGDKVEVELPKKEGYYFYVTTYEYGQDDYCKVDATVNGKKYDLYADELPILKSGDVVTVAYEFKDKTLEDHISVYDEYREDVSYTKDGNTITFVMPEADVDVWVEGYIALKECDATLTRTGEKTYRVDGLNVPKGEKAYIATTKQDYLDLWDDYTAQRHYYYTLEQFKYLCDEDYRNFYLYDDNTYDLFEITVGKEFTLPETSNADAGIILLVGNIKDDESGYGLIGATSAKVFANPGVNETAGISSTIKLDDKNTVKKVSDPDLQKVLDNGGKIDDAQIKVSTVDVKTLDSKVVSKIDELIKAKLPENAVVAQYLDINLEVRVMNKNGNIDYTTATELGSALTLSVKCPEALLNTDATKDRKYYIVRVHGDEVELLEAKLVDGMLVFETDRFSTYAVTYVDEVKKAEENKVVEENKEAEETQKENVTTTPAAKEETATPTTPAKQTNNVKTGDTTNVALFAAIGLVSVLGAFVALRKKEA